MAITLEEFVIKLGLDPSGLTKGQQDAMDSWRKTQEETKKRGLRDGTFDKLRVAKSYQ